MKPFIELLIISLASILPMFFLASRVDADEFAKAGAGLVSATVVAIATNYVTWKKGQGQV